MVRRALSIFRKIILVMLTLAAVGMGLALAFSFYRPIETPFYEVKCRLWMVHGSK